MMPSFSLASQRKLETCSKKLQALFKEVIKTFDCTIIEGHRDANRQNELFLLGKSRVQWPNSNHNKNPSNAVDVVPYLRGIDWRSEIDLLQAMAHKKPILPIIHNIERWTFFAGYVLGIANQMGISVRYGGDWDRDTNLANQDFDDWPHYELTEE